MKSGSTRMPPVAFDEERGGGIKARGSRPLTNPGWLFASEDRFPCKGCVDLAGKKLSHGESAAGTVNITAVERYRGLSTNLGSQAAATRVAPAGRCFK